MFFWVLLPVDPTSRFCYFSTSFNKVTNCIICDNKSSVGCLCNVEQFWLLQIINSTYSALSPTHVFYKYKPLKSLEILTVYDIPEKKNINCTFQTKNCRHISLICNVMAPFVFLSCGCSNRCLSVFTVSFVYMIIVLVCFRCKKFWSFHHLSNAGLGRAVCMPGYKFVKVKGLV